MKKIVDNMWLFVLLLLTVSMASSAVVYLVYMRAHLLR